MNEIGHIDSDEPQTRRGTALWQSARAALTKEPCELVIRRFEDREVLRVKLLRSEGRKFHGERLARLCQDEPFAELRMASALHTATCSNR